MKRYRGSAVIAAAKKERETALTASLANECAMFDALAARARLPWIDQQWYHKELLDVATVADLPRIRVLTDALEEQCDLSCRILLLCEEREHLLSEVVALGQPCTMGRAHQCTEERHMALCSQLEELDHYTEGIIALVVQWRNNLTHPLPFVRKGENYLLRMVGQYATATPLALITAHLRSACRIKPYMYQSPYDLSMPPSLVTHDRAVLTSEMETQQALCEELLGLAKSGLYAPVLKFRVSRPHIPVINKKWKERLVLSYAGARHDLLVALNATAATHIAAQFVQGSERAQTIRYFRKWVEWITRRRDKEKAAADYRLYMDAQLLRSRFHDWLHVRSVRVQRIAGLARLAGDARMALVARCMRRWFLVHKGIVMFEAVRKATCMRYFRSLHFAVLSKRMRASVAGGGGSSTRNLTAAEYLATMRCDLTYLEAIIKGRPRSAVAHAAEASANGKWR